MNFSITGLNDNGLPGIWQASEDYLNVSRQTCAVKSVQNKTIQITPTSNKYPWIITLLKVVSYATVILPVVAAIIRAVYRKRYSIEVVKLTAPNPTPEPQKPPLAAPVENPSITPPAVSPIENPSIKKEYNLGDVIAKIRKAREDGLKLGLFVGRAATQSIPKEKGWLWVSLDREMEKVLDEERLHLQMDFNLVQAPYRIERNCPFDKVVVDYSVLKFFEDPWPVLRRFLASGPESELVVEGSTGVTNQRGINQMLYKPVTGTYVAPFLDEMDDVNYPKVRELVFNNWKGRVGDARAEELYAQYLKTKTPEELQAARQNCGGRDDELKLGFMHKIVQEENRELTTKLLDEERLKELLRRTKQHLETLFGEVILRHAPYLYGDRHPVTDFFVCRFPK